MVEGAPLLREYGPKVHRGFESLSLRQINAPVAQLDRVSGYEPGGRRFESFRARHFFSIKSVAYKPLIPVCDIKTKLLWQFCVMNPYSGHP